MRNLWNRILEGFWNLHARLWWRTRALKARIVCWYIDRIWMPRQPEIKFSVAEQQEALALINEILRELDEEHQNPKSGE